MTIRIQCDAPECTAELKAYVAYRVFMASAPYIGQISAVDVELSPHHTSREQCCWQCRMTASISAIEECSTLKAGRFVVEAVDRSADRLASALRHVLSSQFARIP